MTVGDVQHGLHNPILHVPVFRAERHTTYGSVLLALLGKILDRAKVNQQALMTAASASAWVLLFSARASCYVEDLAPTQALQACHARVEACVHHAGYVYHGV